MRPHARPRLFWSAGGFRVAISGAECGVKESVDHVDVSTRVKRDYLSLRARSRIGNMAYDSTVVDFAVPQAQP